MMYHGTAEANIPEIMNSGLQPKSPCSLGYPVLYLTHSLTEARCYAQTFFVRNNTGKEPGCVIGVDIDLPINYHDSIIPPEKLSVVETGIVFIPLDF